MQVKYVCNIQQQQYVASVSTQSTPPIAKRLILTPVIKIITKCDSPDLLKIEIWRCVRWTFVMLARNFNYLIPRGPASVRKVPTSAIFGHILPFLGTL